MWRILSYSCRTWIFKGKTGTLWCSSKSTRPRPKRPLLQRLMPLWDQVCLLYRHMVHVCTTISHDMRASRRSFSSVVKSLERSGRRRKNDWLVSIVYDMSSFFNVRAMAVLYCILGFNGQLLVLKGSSLSMVVYIHSYTILYVYIHRSWGGNIEKDECWFE